MENDWQDEIPLESPEPGSIDCSKCGSVTDPEQKYLCDNCCKTLEYLQRKQRGESLG
jgi:transposase-like protein